MYAHCQLLPFQEQSFMVIFKAYFDESGKHTDHPVVSFGGVCAQEHNVEAFNQAWRKVLDFYKLPSLHMKEAARYTRPLSSKVPAQTLEQRMAVVKPFVDCINSHLEVGFIQAWDVEGFRSLSKTARAALGSPEDPYHLAFVRGILSLVDYVHEDSKISVICDDDETTAWDCYRYYRGARRADPKIQKYVVSLSFADDRYFPALQASDMVAWLARLEAKRRFNNIPYAWAGLLDYLISDQGPGRVTWYALFADKLTAKKLSNGVALRPSRARKSTL